jgi:hypothetical protein
MGDDQARLFFLFGNTFLSILVSWLWLFVCWLYLTSSWSRILGSRFCLQLGTNLWVLLGETWLYSVNQLWARASPKLELEQGSRQALSDFSNALTCVLYQEQSATLYFLLFCRARLYKTECTEEQKFTFFKWKMPDRIRHSLDTLEKSVEVFTK